VKRVSFDEEVELHINQIIHSLNSMGIRNVSKPQALRVIIQMNREAQIKLRRKPRSRYGLMMR
jgi:hypothetical protein